MKANLKYFAIFIFLFTVVMQLNAKPTKDIMNSSSPVVCPDDPSLSAGGGFITFYGVLDIWTTPSGAVIIDCDPPFYERCYTLIWSFDTPNQKTVKLNDENQTEITVTSGPVITTGENGTEIHTFTR